MNSQSQIPSQLQPGQMLGPYQIIHQVGKGGMATVFNAHHAAMDRHVAVKVLLHQFAYSEEFLGRFRQEVRLIAKLEHPHILPVYDYGESNGIPYLVMRYLQAGTLQDRMEAGQLTLSEIDRLFTQLADALGYAHAHGIIHRDIKPSNALVDQRGNLFLTDFGIAKLVEGTAKFTASGAITGTPAYMSPEQAQGYTLDARSDIYSLGVVLYEMLTGRVPYEAETPLAVILKHVQAPLPPPSAVNPAIAPALEALLLKALAKAPADRFPSVPAMLDAWRRAFATSTDVSAMIPPPLPVAPDLMTLPPAMPPPTAEPLPKKQRGWLLPTLGAGAVMAILCGGMVVLAVLGYLIFGDRSPPTGPVPPTDTPEPVPSSTPTVELMAAEPMPDEPLATSEAVDPLARDGDLEAAPPLDWTEILDLSGLNATCPSHYILPPFIEPEHGSVEVADQILEDENKFNWPTAAGEDGTIVLTMDVTSLVEDSRWIRLPNEVTAIVAAEAEDVPAHANVVRFGGCGGGGEIRYFSPVALDASLDTYELPAAYPEVDYFSLEPGEFELFHFTFECKRPGKYYLMVDLPFSIRDEEGVASVFSEDLFICPESFTLWDLFFDVQYVGDFFWNGEYYEQEK